MENNQNFQTSFIPKKPLSEEREQQPRKKQKGVSLLTMIGIFVFVVSILAAGGVFVYKSVLENQVDEKKSTLEQARNTFDPALVEQLRNFDRRLKVADQLVENHTLVTPLFDAIGDLTMKSVRFDSVNVSVNREEGLAIDAAMSGEARSYTSIALQSDLLASHQYIVDPIFTDLNLDEAGNVSFNLSYSVDPDLLSYPEYFARMQQNTPTNQQEEQPSESETEQTDETESDEEAVEDMSDNGQEAETASEDTDAVDVSQPEQ